MIVCATPRCGGTIFCIEEARRMNIAFAGEFNPQYLTGLGEFGDMKESNHETRFQPRYQLKDFISHLLHLSSPEKLYLVNDNVSFALPSSSVRIATRDLDRAFRSMADYVLRSSREMSSEAQFDLVKRFCRAQLLTNILITQFCALTGKELLFFEDRYESKGSYPELEKHPLLHKMKAYFGYLRLLDKKHS